MPDRYFSETPISQGSVVLTGAEAHHLLHVMRAGPGTQVVLFDGSGAEFTAAVRRIGRSEVQLDVLSREAVDRELPLELTLGVALPKGERQKWLVEKAVELGVSRIVPLQTTRGVAQPLDQALARLRRTVIEASKQCGRNRLLEIVPPQCWADFVASGDDGCERLMAHPADHGGASQAQRIAIPQSPRCCLLAVGPEGGFADDEVSLALAAGWQPVSLGPRILRVETAALALVAMVTRRVAGFPP